MGKPERYHHGNLRRALLEAGLELLEERGVDGITLREVARRAGVSHAAPYHHFADKASLVEALAVSSFQAFTQALERAWDATSGASLERLRAVGLAYVRFALERPAEFRLMNRPELRRPKETSDAGPVKEAARASFEVLLQGIRACQEEGLVAPGDPEPLALAAWSLVHGLAVLAMDGLLGDGALSPQEGEGLAEVVTGALGQGLIVRSRTTSPTS